MWQRLCVVNTRSANNAANSDHDRHVCSEPITRASVYMTRSFPPRTHVGVKIDSPEPSKVRADGEIGGVAVANLLLINPREAHPRDICRNPGFVGRGHLIPSSGTRRISRRIPAHSAHPQHEITPPMQSRFTRLLAGWTVHDGVLAWMDF